MNRLLVALAVLLAVLALGGAWLLLGRAGSADAAASPGAGQTRATEPQEMLELDGARAPDSRSSHEVAAVTDATQAAQSDEAGADADAESIRIVVLDQDREPIEGARVRSEGGRGGVEFETDEQGECELSAVPEEGQFALEIEAEGFRHERTRLSLADRIEVRLHRMTRVSGRVLERGSSAPVAGARIELPDGHQDCEREVVLARADGSFELSTAPVGLPFRLELSADGFANALQDLQILDPDDPGRMQLELERSAGVRFLVQDFQTGLPIAGAELGLPSGTSKSGERGEVDASALVSESAGTITLRLSAPRYCNLHRKVEPREWRESRVLPIPMLRAASWEGVVLDPDGNPVEGARVELGSEGERAVRGGPPEFTLPDGWPREWSLSAEPGETLLSAANGRFRVHGVVPGTPDILISAHKPGWEAARVLAGKAGGPGQVGWLELCMRPEPSGRMSGRLTLNGESVRGRVVWRGALREGFGTADRQGRFELANVEPGKVRLSARPRLGGDDYGTLLDDLGFEIELELGASLERDLPLEVGLAPITGKVRTSAGEVLAGVQVIATLREKEARFQATTDQDGRFELAVPDRPGDYRLMLVGRWSAARRTASAGTRELEFVVEERGRVRLRLVDEGSGRALRDYEIYGKGSSQRSFQHLTNTSGSPTDPEGWCQFEAPSGPMQFQIAPRDRRFPPAHSAGVVPPPGASPLRLNLTVPTGHRIVLRLAEGVAFPPRGSEPWLLEDEHVALLPARAPGTDPWSVLNQVFPDQRAMRDRRITFSKDRTATLRGLADGRYRLLNPIRPVVFEPATIELPRDAKEPIEVRWKPAD